METMIIETAEMKKINDMVLDFINAWNDALDNDPRVERGEIDALESEKVMECERRLAKEGYTLEYDADEEGFWVFSRIGKGVFGCPVVYSYC